MSYQTVATLLVDRRDNVSIITLNRPEKKNALSRELRDDLVQCLTELEQDGDTKAIVLTGAGTTFCAGFDLDEFKTGNMREIFAHATGYHHKVYNCTLPIVAAVNGPAMAGGMDLATMCDVRVISAAAKFGQPQVKMGIAAAFDLMQTVLPEALCRELCLTGRSMDASEACSTGFAARLTGEDELLRVATELASEIASYAGSRQMKKTFLDSQPDLFGNAPE